MDSIDFISKLLANSNGKDKVMRIVSYSSMLFASSRICPPGLKKSLVILSSELSSARTVLRLFDDLPMLNYSLSCLRNSNRSLEIFEQLSLWKVKLLELNVTSVREFSAILSQIDIVQICRVRSLTVCFYRNFLKKLEHLSHCPNVSTTP